MSDQITKGVLRYFGNIFGVARSGPRLIDLDLAILPTLDVNRAAELGSGVGRADGWCCSDVAQVHAGAGSLTSTTDLIAQLATALPGIFDPSQHLAWLFETTLFSGTTGIITSGFARTGEEVQGTNFIRLWRSWTGALVDSGADTGIPVFVAQRPVPMLGANFLFTASSTAAGAGTLTQRNLFWIGSRGARPPFVA